MNGTLTGCDERDAKLSGEITLNLGVGDKLHSPSAAKAARENEEIYDAHGNDLQPAPLGNYIELTQK